MFTSSDPKVLDLMSDYDVKHVTSRISRKGNLVVSGDGQRITHMFDDGVSSGGTVTYYSITIVLTPEDTLIECKIEEDDYLDF